MSDADEMFWLILMHFTFSNLLIFEMNWGMVNEIKHNYVEHSTTRMILVSCWNDLGYPGSISQQLAFNMATDLWERQIYDWYK